MIAPGEWGDVFVMARDITSRPVISEGMSSGVSDRSVQRRPLSSNVSIRRRKWEPMRPLNGVPAPDLSLALDIVVRW